MAPGATLGGYGSVTGAVMNDGVIGVAMPVFADDPTGTFTINGNLLNRGLLELVPAIGNTLFVNGDYTSAGGSLHIETLLNGGGALTNQFTDRLLVIGNAAGVTTVQVKTSGSGAVTSVEPPDAADGISVVQVAGSSSAGASQLAGGYVSGDTPYQYHPFAYGPGSPNGPGFAPQSLVGGTGNHWDYRLQNAYVTPDGEAPPGPVPPTPPGPTPTPQPPLPPVPPDARLEVDPQVPAYLTAPTVLFNAGLQDLDQLHRRLGEIRDDQTFGRGGQGEVFARVLGGTYDYSTNRGFRAFGFDSSEETVALQFGGTRIAVNDADGTLRLGLAGTLGKLWYNQHPVDGLSQGRFNSSTLAGIATYQDRAGWYVDAIFMGGLINGEVSTAARGQTTGFNGTSFAASLEGGYPFTLDFWGASAEPQVQLVYQSLDFGQRTDVDGIQVALGNPNQGIARVGVRLFKPLTDEEGMRLTPYVKANLLQGIGGGSTVQVGGVGFGTGRFGTAMQIRGGVTGTVTQAVSLYGDVGWQHDLGDGGFRGWSFNAGLRVVF